MEYLQHLLMRSLWVVLVVMLAVENGCNGCLEKERIALLQLKDSINFPNGIFLPSWEEDDNMDCCQWERVECNSTTHRVIKLELYGARDWIGDYWHLNASILLPFESLRSLNLSRNCLSSFVGNEGIGTLSNLHYLEELDLSDNILDNSILPSLNKLSNLKILNLGSNALNGSISAKGIGTLSNLHYLEALDLSMNHLDNSILPSLNKLSNLKILNLASNELNGSISAKDCSAPNKGHFITGRWPQLIALLRCDNRDAPNLLGYKPTYFGFADRKDKSKMVRKPVDLASVAGQALASQYLAQDLSTSGLPSQEKQPDKAPSAAATAQAAVTAEPVKRRRVKRPTTEGEGPSEKKKKVSKDDAKVVPGFHSETAVEASGETQPFLPNFTCPDGRAITVADSLAESPLLAMTLLKGVALPKDMASLPKEKANNMAELCLLLAKAGQCASRAFDDVEFLLETRRSLRTDIQAVREQALRDREQIEKLETQVAEAKAGLEEKDRLLAEVQDLKVEKDRLIAEAKKAAEELPKLLEEAGDAGFNEAGEDYAKQVDGLVKEAFKKGEAKGIQETHPTSFLRGYQVGLDYAEVPKDDHRREPPVVPPVEPLVPSEEAEAQAVVTPSPAADAELDADADPADDIEKATDANASAEA